MFLQGVGGVAAAQALLARGALSAERAPLTAGLPQAAYDMAAGTLPGKRR
jgi:hypothetical protein